MTSARFSLVILSVLGAALVALTAAGLALLYCDPSALDPRVRDILFTIDICAAGAVWLGAVAWVRRVVLPPEAIWIVLAVAVAMRAIALTAPNILSTDIYRYVWDGRVQLAGINPYRYIPAAPELAFLRDHVVYPFINRADYARTIYPPAAEAVFAIAAGVAPGTVGLKLVMLCFDALTIGALAALLRIAGRRPAELLIYAWLPLTVWEFAGSGHVDAVAAGLLTLALLQSARGRQARTGILLAAATLTKFLPGVVLPAFWRPGNRRLPVAFLATIAAFYLPYITVGRHVLGFLGGYATEEGLDNGHGIFLLQVLSRATPLPNWAAPAYGAAVLAILALLAVRFTFTGDRAGRHVTVQTGQALILAALLLVAISPHYPWYFAWIAPLACLAPYTSVLWLLATAPVLTHGSIEYLLVPAAVYVPAAALFILDLYRARADAPLLPQPVARNAG